MKKKKKSIDYGKWGYIFILPFFVAYIIFSLIPLIDTVRYSFFEYYRSGIKEVGPNFIGMANYVSLLHSDMLKYGVINGVHAANSKDLCTRIAREEWGFDGVIMSDWNTTVPEDGSIPWVCVAAGNDIIMPGNPDDDKNIRDAYKEGKLTEKEIRLCANRILKLIRRLS